METDHDSKDAPRDDVRTVRKPAVAGPHYRNLGLAAGTLLFLIAVAVLVAPLRPRAPKSEPAAAEESGKTFLDVAPELSEDETTLDPRRPWWKRGGGSAQAPEEELAIPAGDVYPAWPNDAPADPLPVAPDARRQALEKALRSSRLRKAEKVAILPGRTAESALTDPILAAAAAVLPSPEQVARMLAGVGAGGGAGERPGAMERPGAGERPGQSPAASTFADGLGDAPWLKRPASVPAGFSVPAAGISPPPAGLSPSAPVAAGTGPVGIGTGPVAATGARVLVAGTLIPAQLQTAIDSDSPGPVTARVIRDVLDASGAEVLIPAGALLLGSVGSQLAYGEDRALVAFERLILPGRSYDLPGLDALETSGTRGLADQVNRHLWPNLGRAVLLAALGAGFELGQPDRGASERLRPGELVASRMALELDRVAAEVLRQGMDRRPTVRIRAGERFYVYLNRDLGL